MFWQFRKQMEAPSVLMKSPLQDFNLEPQIPGVILQKLGVMSRYPEGFLQTTLPLSPVP